MKLIKQLKEKYELDTDGFIAAHQLVTDQAWIDRAVLALAEEVVRVYPEADIVSYGSGGVFDGGAGVDFCSAWRCNPTDAAEDYVLFRAGLRMDRFDPTLSTNWSLLRTSIHEVMRERLTKATSASDAEWQPLEIPTPPTSFKH